MSLTTMTKITQTNTACSAAVVFLHGSGDSGQGFLNWIKFLIGDFTSPHIKFYFPTAPLRPYTPLNGEPSYVWFDRYIITPDVAEHVESLSSIGNVIKSIINDIVKEGVPLNRIIVGGFSMGGALALHSAFRFTPGLAGVFALSSFLNKNSTVYTELKAPETPLYMCHGEKDSMVPISWGKKTFEELEKLHVKGEFVPIRFTLHELKKSELEGLFQWIAKILPPIDSDNP
ncbi:lysophospholipase-like protein 1 [Cylas formicarius]|uniref:lysophospholipase-like protein 1 n=1 Tax=Cylas formicarius TaxID=197179 RepID=UPI002958DB51|nr:lysophospholipase-like protein 1 [Cylas formicarius]XP_060531041.1 lysophospholipase-like protein 1 [Cylas formicarius]XP_060531042.1 lysophospholipase-like protein 1 [Cylas formicarius]